MPPAIVDQPWPPEAGEDLRRPDGRPVVCPTTGRVLRAYHDQLVVWATLTPGKQPPPASPSLFPVLLDTGFNETFVMQRRQAEAWLTPAVFATFPGHPFQLKIGPELIPAWNVSLWVYPNVPGARDPDSSGSPVRIRAVPAIWLTPSGSAYTKEKPLLGLRALRFNGLSLRIDGAAGRFSLDAP